MSFPNTEHVPHFDRTAFKIIGKRIFATLHHATDSANLKLYIEDQSAFCKLGDHIYPVPNKWGTHGWTTIELNNCTEEVFKSALESAYLQVGKK